MYAACLSDTPVLTRLLLSVICRRMLHEDARCRQQDKGKRDARSPS